MKPAATWLPTILCMLAGCRSPDRPAQLPPAPPASDLGSRSAPDRIQKNDLHNIAEKPNLARITQPADLDRLLDRGKPAQLVIGGDSDGGVAIKYSDGSRCSIVPRGVDNSVELVYEEGSNRTTQIVSMTEEVYEQWINQKLRVIQTLLGK